MSADRALSRIVRAARPARPLMRLTLPPNWARVLVAAGARPAGTDDSMTVSFTPARPGRRPSRRDGMRTAPGGGDLAPAATVPVSITEVCIHAFGDALVVGNLVRGGSAVRMDVSQLSLSDARRLVDFAAGLTFGLRGSMERVERRVFLLSPAADLALVRLTR